MWLWLCSIEAPDSWRSTVWKRKVAMADWSLRNQQRRYINIKDPSYCLFNLFYPQLVWPYADSFFSHFRDWYCFAVSRYPSAPISDWRFAGGSSRLPMSKRVLKSSISPQTWDCGKSLTSGASSSCTNLNFKVQSYHSKGFSWFFFGL